MSAFNIIAHLTKSGVLSVRGLCNIAGISQQTFLSQICIEVTFVETVINCA